MKLLLDRGIEVIEELFDLRLRCIRKNSVYMELMICVVVVCVINEEFWRFGMEEIVIILKGGEGGLEIRIYLSRKINISFLSMIDIYI